MIPVGDDFAYTNGQDDFVQIEILRKALQTYASNIGYNSEVKYNSLYSYFEEIKSMNLEFSSFKGDFLPYYEQYQGWNWNDFWTGFYSTRPHFKAYITHTFHQLQSLKTLLAIKAVENSEEGELESKFEILKEIEDLTKLAERKWAITLHHDAITGTHKEHVGEDYYKILGDANEFINQAYQKILINLGNKISDDNIDTIESFVAKLNNDDQINFLRTYTIGIKDLTHNYELNRYFSLNLHLKNKYLLI